jgi:hypothetical protein
MTFSGKLAVPLAAMTLPCVLAACKKYGNSKGDAIYNEITAVGADNAC